MQESLDWNELRLALAIARAGSLAGAARALSVSHATVFRRLKTLEARLGVALFERDRGGYTATVAGDDLAEAAARVEQEVLGVQRRVAGRDLRPSGTVRLTTTDTLFEGLLAPVLAECRRAYPDIELEVAISNEPFNLTRRQADMAIRPIAKPPEALIARRLGRVALAVYAAADAGEPGPPKRNWLGLDDSVSFPALETWMARHAERSACRFRMDSLLGLRAAVRSGAGQAVLPCYLADDDPALARLAPPIEEVATDLWLLIHPDLRKVARIRAVRDVIAGALARAAVQKRLAGESPDQ